MINIKCYLLLVVSGASNLNITAKRFSTTLMNHHGRLFVYIIIYFLGDIWKILQCNSSTKAMHRLFSANKGTPN